MVWTPVAIDTLSRNLVPAALPHLGRVSRRPEGSSQTVGSKGVTLDVATGTL